ncbi:hypothetical protein CR513_21082, partial [Mucuna pruriens]
MCKVDFIAYTGLVERERIFKFLHSLNFEYDPIHVQILGKEKLPYLSEVFSIVKSEETRRSIMLDKGSSNIGSAIVKGKGFTKRSTSEGKSFTKSSHGKYCMYCKQPGYTKDTYYKLYGKEKVLKRMSENKVIKKQLITTANGDHVPIVGSGNVQLQSSLSLHNVLHVPKLVNNLISIHRLIQDWNCSVTFFRSHCVIQELTMGKMIGIAKEQDNGVVHELTYVNTPQQKGVAKRKNHHLLKVARALLFQMSISNVYSGEVVLTATYLINRLPTHVLNVQEVIKLTMVLEQVQLFELEVSILENPIEDITDDMVIALRKEKKSCVKYPISQFVCTDHLLVQHQCFIIAIDAIKTPASVQEALKDENWIQAMKEEMKALKKNSTWEIVDRLKDKRVVGYR